MKIPIVEKQFLAQVRALAQIRGWREYHTYDSRHSTAGFPDLCMVREGRLIFAELKTEKRAVTKEQLRWLDDLDDVECCEVYVWRPSDWDDIVEILK